MSARLAVLGAGAWGLTLADLLARKGHEVTVWDQTPEHLERLRRDRIPGKPPGLCVCDAVRFEENFASAVVAAEAIICVVASHGVRSMCERIAALPGGIGRRVFVSCSKGIEEGSLLLPSQIFEEVLGGDGVAGQFAVLSGPSHAEEVCKGIPTVVVSSSTSWEVACRVRDLFMLPTFRVYTQGDCRGVELGAALKNVIAIAAGVTDGVGFGDNTKAALITRGLAEITRAGGAMGAHAQTFAGVAGLGDLVVTAMSRHSRNRAFGELLAKGLSVQEALKEVGAVVEGYRTCRSAHCLSQKIGVEMPITSAVYSVLYEGVSIPEALEALLQRDPKPEIY